MPRATLRVKLSDNPALAILLDAAKLQPTDRELELAGERQKARIIGRTQRGVDYLGKPFAPYSTKGPFYWYPSGPSRSKHSRQAAASRYARRLKKPLTRSKLGIRFESYADFKRSLGRGTAVDLTGPQSPHMLQSIVVTVQNGVIILGFYDPKKAAIALGHNTGAMTGRGHKTKLPKRQFLGISPDDRRDIREDVTAAIRAKLGTSKSQPTPRWAAQEMFSAFPGKIVK